MLGGITGIEAAHAIRSQRPACRIILFSGHARPADLLAEAAALGHIFDIYAKPVHPQTLMDALGPIPLPRRPQCQPRIEILNPLVALVCPRLSGAEIPPRVRSVLPATLSPTFFYPLFAAVSG